MSSRIIKATFLALGLLLTVAACKGPPEFEPPPPTEQNSTTNGTDNKDPAGNEDTSGDTGGDTGGEPGGDAGEQPPEKPAEPELPPSVTKIKIINLCADFFTDKDNFLGATGVSIKLYDAATGFEKFSNATGSYPLSVKKFVTENKFLPINVTSIPDGDYFLALCNVDKHQACLMTLQDAKDYEAIIANTSMSKPNTNNGLLGGVPKLNIKSGAFTGDPSGVAYLGALNSHANCERPMTISQ